MVNSEFVDRDAMADKVLTDNQTSINGVKGLGESWHLMTFSLIISINKSSQV